MLLRVQLLLADSKLGWRSFLGHDHVGHEEEEEEREEQPHGAHGCRHDYLLVVVVGDGRMNITIITTSSSSSSSRTIYQSKERQNTIGVTKSWLSTPTIASYKVLRNCCFFRRNTLQRSEDCSSIIMRSNYCWHLEILILACPTKYGKLPRDF